MNGLKGTGKVKSPLTLKRERDIVTYMTFLMVSYQFYFINRNREL